MELGGPSRDGKAQSAASGLRREERLEDLIAYVGGDAGAVVANRDDGGAVLARDVDRNAAPTAHRLRGIEQHVLQRFSKLFNFCVV
jgi:hypothetical protein